MERLQIDILGGIRATKRDGKPLKFRTWGAALLLAFLALHPDQEHPRSQLVLRFWPDAPEDNARQSLSMALTTFRQSLGKDFESIFIVSRHTLGLRSAAIACDARRFRELLETVGDAREAAVDSALDLYKGELALGFFEPDNVPPDLLWLEDKREALKGLQQTALVEKAIRHEQRGELRAASITALRVEAPELLSELDQERYLQLAARATTSERAVIPLLREGMELVDVPVFERQLAQIGETPLEEERQLLRRILSESIARLSERERWILVVLSLFHGSFSLGIVEGVTKYTQHKQLGSLCKKHLLSPSDLGKNHYALSNAVRELVGPMLSSELRQQLLRRIACWFAARLYWQDSGAPASSLTKQYQPLFDENATLRATLNAHLASGCPRDLRRATWLIFQCHMYWELLGCAQERFEWLWQVFELQEHVPTSYLPRLWTNLLDSMGGCVDPAKWLPLILERLPELEQRIDRGRVGLLLMTAGYHAHHAEHNEQALTFFEVGLARVDAEILSQREKIQLAKLLCGYSEALQVQGFPEEALSRCEQALLIAQGYEEVATMEQLYSELLLHQGRLHDAERLVEKGLATIFPSARPQMQELALRKLGNIYATQGRFGLAAAAFQHGLLLCEQFGAREPASDCQRGLGTIHLYQGQLAQARVHFEEGIAIWRELNHHRWQVLFLHLLARVSLQEGDLAAVVKNLEEAQTHLELTRSPGADAYALWLQAELVLEQGDPHRAVTLHRQALDLRVRFSPKHLQMESEDGLAYALELLGEQEEANLLRLSVEAARDAFGIRETNYRKLGTS